MRASYCAGRADKEGDGMQIERMRLITAAQAAQASMAENKVPGLAMAFFSGGEMCIRDSLYVPAHPARPFHGRAE